MIADLAGSLRRLTMRVNALISRSVINLVNDSLETQRLQLTILADEVVPDVEHLEPYGMSFVPPVGSDALALGVKGMRSHTVAICAHAHGERPTGNPPRTGGLYQSGAFLVFLDENGVVHIGAQQGAEPVALADKVDAEFKRIGDLLSGTAGLPIPWAPVPQDGGAALQTAAKGTQEAVQSVAATKARAT